MRDHRPGSSRPASAEARPASAEARPASAEARPASAEARPASAEARPALVRKTCGPGRLRFRACLSRVPSGGRGKGVRLGRRRPADAARYAALAAGQRCCCQGCAPAAGPANVVHNLLHAGGPAAGGPAAGLLRAGLLRACSTALDKWCQACPATHPCVLQPACTACFNYRRCRGSGAFLGLSRRQGPHS